MRYDYVDNAPHLDEEMNKLIFETEPITPEVAVDYGNKSNYIEGETTVISVFKEGENTLQIIKDDSVIEEIKVDGYTKIEKTFEKGYYKVKLEGSDEYAEFCVCKPEISYTLNENKTSITITASSNDEKSKIHHLDLREPGEDIWTPLSRIELLNEEEITSGIFERKVHKNIVGSFKVCFKNEYGIWTIPVNIDYSK